MFGLDRKTVRKMLKFSVPPGDHRTLPRAQQRQPCEGHAAARAGPSRGLRGQDQYLAWSLFTPPRWSHFSPPLTVIPSLNKALVLELARCEYIERRENLIALGNSGTGKTHMALGLGLAACQKGLSVGFITAAALVHELIEARDDKQLLRFQKKLATYKLLIVDELGFVPLSKTGAELLFEVFSQRYERGSTLITTNLPFDEWTEVFGSERLTGALLDRLTHHVNILEMNGDSYRLNQSRRRQTPTAN